MLITFSWLQLILPKNLEFYGKLGKYALSLHQALWLSRESPMKKLDLDSACLLTTRITSTAKFWALNRPREKQHEIANNTSFPKKTLVYHLLGGRFLCLWECGEITGLAGAITSKSTTLIVSQWLTRYATIAHRYTRICNKPTLWQVSATQENKLGYFC